MPSEDEGPVRLTMQPLATSNSLAHGAGAGLDIPLEPVPMRWRQALHNVTEAKALTEQLASSVEGALYLDVQDWRQAVPISQYHQERNVLQGTIRTLESGLSSCQKDLAATNSELSRTRERLQEVEGELESHEKVFRLHYETLLEKEQTIQDLEAVISALSLATGDDDAHGEA